MRYIGALVLGLVFAPTLAWSAMAANCGAPTDIQDYDCDCIRAEFAMMGRFLFFVLVERHRVAAHTSSRPWAAAMPGLSA